MKININKTFFILLTTILVFSVIVTASMLIPANDKAKENSQAPESSPVIDEIWELERIDFIHYIKPENPGKPQKTETCYKLMGIKWESLPVNYVINPTNSELDESFVLNTISTSAETWDSATSSELFNDAYEVNYNAEYGIQDFQNAIDFNQYSNNNVIAVTSVWYTPKGRQIVEFDIRFNTRFNWGDATLNSAIMDLQNIATHELGHGVGLGDIYFSTCTDVTMYGYSTEGETSKRTLEQADITGLQRMYSI